LSDTAARWGAALASARDSLAAASEAQGRLEERFDADAYDRAIKIIAEACAAGGRVHVTGVGKPEHLARYAASLLASTGTPAYFLHATEALHGSAGQVTAGDVVIAISNSGSTPELLGAVALVRGQKARVVAVVGVLDSKLGDLADAALDAGVAREGGGLGLAPRASAGAELAVLAALSAGLESLSGWTRADFHAHHPSGALGAKSREPDEAVRGER
jgi:arabinose-5-phosphate isomerase